MCAHGKSLLHLPLVNWLSDLAGIWSQVFLEKIVMHLAIDFGRMFFFFFKKYDTYSISSKNYRSIQRFVLSFYN